MRQLCIRFDIDTHRCMRDGVPRLLELASRLQVQFTFFVNMGRAVDRKHALARSTPALRPDPEPAVKLSPRTKLGLTGYLYAAIVNPRVGSGSPELVVQILREGHELGLHGGNNHGSWHHGAGLWNREALRREVSDGLAMMSALGLSTPQGFASPGFQGNPELAQVLEEKGFAYLADRHGPGLEKIEALDDASRLISVATNLLGGQGVGYLESLAASGLSSRERRERFARDLGEIDQYALMYDHPCFAGAAAINDLEALIEVARDQGFALTTIAQLVSSHRVASEGRP